MDKTGWQDFHAAAVARGFTGTQGELTQLFLAASDASDWRLARSLWAQDYPKAQVEFLDRVRACLARRFISSKVFPDIGLDYTTLSFTSRRDNGPKRGIEAVSIQVRQGSVYFVAKIDGDWRRTKTVTFPTFSPTR